MKTKFISIILSSLIFVIGCVTANIETKAWHTSPDGDYRSSTIYPAVKWATIKKLHPGMSSIEAKKLIHDLQYYHHPMNAIVYSTKNNISYEIALKLSKDKTIIEDISFKKLAD